MAAIFARTSVLDNFNRADVGPPPSSQWSGPHESAMGVHKVTSNQCAPNTAFAGSY